MGLLATDVDPASGGVSAKRDGRRPVEATAAERLVTATARRVATLPFDHAPRATSALLDDEGRRFIVVKGAPEQVMAKCAALPDAAQRTLAALFNGGHRVVAVASKPAPGLTALTADDECGLALNGFLVFADEPKAAARDSLAQLAALGIEVKVATGDNPSVAEKVCSDLGLPSKGTITSAEMETLDEAGFYADPMQLACQPHRTRDHVHRIQRRAARFSHGGKIARPISRG